MPSDIIALANKIEEFIKKSPQGVSIQDVAKQFDISRYEAVYALGILIGRGNVGCHEIGPVKLHYYKSDKSKGGE